MRQIFAIFIFLAAAFSAAAQQPDFEALFRERAKTCVGVKYILEMEESRTEVRTGGLVARPDGTVLMPSSAIPYFSRPSNLKDFRVFFEGGDSDGYSAEFLGFDAAWRVYFLRIKNGLPKGVKAVSEFKNSKLGLGDWAWGVEIADSLDYAPCVRRSYVMLADVTEKNEAVFANPIAGKGLGVFDAAGDFAGWAQDSALDFYTMIFSNNQSIPVRLRDDPLSRTVVPADSLPAILARIPSKPEGDKSGWIGISDIRPVKREVAKFMGIEKIGAVVVGRVFDDSPAKKAGVAEGDIIVEFDGKPLPRLRSDDYTLSAFIFKNKQLKPDTQHKMKVMRGDKTLELQFTTGTFPRELRESQYKYFKRLGFSVREFVFDDAISRKMRTSSSQSPVVQFVKRNSPAASAQPNGLSPSVIIREINSQPVKTYEQAVETLSKIDADKGVSDLVLLVEDYKETKLLRVKLD